MNVVFLCKMFNRPCIMEKAYVNKQKLLGGTAMNLLMTVTDAQAAAAGEAVVSPIVWILYFGVLIGIFYFLFYRPQKKEQKRRTALVNSVEVGDSVLTTSGFYGIIIDVTDEDVIVEFGNNKNCRIPMKKSAIEQIEKADAE